MKHSITGKITAIMISIVTGTVLLCWFANNSLLENYYVEHKQKKLLDTFEMADKAIREERENEESFQIELEKQCANSNITMMIISSDRTIMHSNVGDDEELLLQFMELIFHVDRHKAKVLENTEQYMVEKTKDKIGRAHV